MEKLRTEIYKIEARVQRLQNLLSEVTSAEGIIKEGEERGIHEKKEAQERLNETRMTIKNLESDRRKIEEELNKIGQLPFWQRLLLFLSGRQKELRENLLTIDKLLS